MDTQGRLMGVNIALPQYRERCYYKDRLIAFEAIILCDIKAANSEYSTLYDRYKHFMTVLGKYVHICTQYLRGL